MSKSEKIDASKQTSTFERRSPANRILQVIEEKRKQVAYVNGEGDEKYFVNTKPTRIEDICEQNNLWKYKKKYYQTIDVSKLQQMNIWNKIIGSAIKISIFPDSKNKKSNIQMLVFKEYSSAKDRITETVLLKFKDPENGMVVAWNGAFSDTWHIMLWKKDIYSVYRFFATAQLEDPNNPIKY